MQWHNIGTSKKRTMDDFEEFLNRELSNKKFLIVGTTLVRKSFGSAIRRLDNTYFKKEFKKWSKHKTT